MIDINKIFPLSKFQTSKKLRNDIYNDKAAYILTTNGKSCFVVQNVDSYQELAFMAEYGQLWMNDSKKSMS